MFKCYLNLIHVSIPPQPLVLQSTRQPLCKVSQQHIQRWLVVRGESWKTSNISNGSQVAVIVFWGECLCILSHNRSRLIIFGCDVQEAWLYFWFVGLWYPSSTKPKTEEWMCSDSISCNIKTHRGHTREHTLTHTHTHTDTDTDTHIHSRTRTHTHIIINIG